MAFQFRLALISSSFLESSTDMTDQHHRTRRNARKQNLFQKDCTLILNLPNKVKLLMYAFGDDPNPSPESVMVLEDIVTEYLNEMVAAPR
jgi:hypothetical protein